MSLFSERLTAYMNENDIKKQLLCQISGIERTFLHKIISGTRMPSNHEMVRKLAFSLHLTPEQHSDLLRAYQISKVGELQYYRRREVASMLFGMDTVRILSKPVVPARSSVSFPTICEGVNPIRALIKQLFEVEISSDGFVHLLSQPDNPFIMNLIQTHSGKRRNFKVHHIICFDHAAQKEIYNIETMGRLLPAVLASDRYFPFYYYNTVESMFSKVAPFPILLVTTHCAMQITSDWSTALCFEPGTDPYKLLCSRFDSCFELCQPVVTRLGDPMEQLQYYAEYHSNIEKAGKEDFFILMPELCAISFFTRELYEEYLIQEIPDRAALIDRLVLYSEHSLATLDCKKTTHYATKEGILRFLESGRLLELPPDSYTPFSVDCRKYLLNSFLDVCEDHRAALRLYDPEVLPFPPNISLGCGTASAMLSLVCIHPTRGFVSLSIDESTVTASIIDYFVSLQENPNLLSAEDSVSEIRALLETFPG